MIKVHHLVVVMFLLGSASLFCGCFGGDDPFRGERELTVSPGADAFGSSGGSSHMFSSVYFASLANTQGSEDISRKVNSLQELSKYLGSLSLNSDIPSGELSIIYAQVKAMIDRLTDCFSPPADKMRDSQ